MMYSFIDDAGTFTVNDPLSYQLYFPLTDKDGSLLSAVCPNLAGDIKKDNDRFLTPPASVPDTRYNLLCRRDFFLKTEGAVIRASYPYRDKLEAGFLYHRLIKQAHHLQIEVLNFIPFDLAVEVMQVKIANKSGKTVTITPTSFVPLFGRGEKNLRDHRHVSSLLNRIDLDTCGIFLRPTMVFDEKGHRENKDNYFVLGYEGTGKPPVGQFPTLDYFCGSSDLISPDAIEKDTAPVTKKAVDFDGKEACAAFRFRTREVAPQEELTYCLVMGIEEDRGRARRMFRKLDSPEKVAKKLEETKQYWRRYLSAIKFDFRDRDFNNWLLWVRLQPTLRKLFGCSFLPHFDYGKGGRGWRDLWQDALTLLLTEPDKAAALIFNNFKGVRLDGSNATIVTADGEFIADRNKISRVWMDHGVWPYLTLREYLHQTGNARFLLQETEYFRDQHLKRAKEIDHSFAQQDYVLRTRNKKIYRGSILEHVLIQMLVAFFNVGQHNAIRLENADWNDGLDMASEKGESATFSFMYAHNLRDVCFFLRQLQKEGDSVLLLKEIALLLDRIHTPVDYKSAKRKQERLNEYLEAAERTAGEKIRVKLDDLIDDLQHKSAHLFKSLSRRQFLKRGFFNGYYDNKSKAVEGNVKGGVRMRLESQVFAIMSGGASDRQIRSTWNAINKYLRDKRLGGFRLNTDFKALYMDLGRAFGFAYGEKENGAFFDHMAVMLANALYKRGFIREGSEVMHSIYAMATSSRARIYPMIPEYFNNQGRGLYLYLTGSASWYAYTLMKEVLGIKFILGRIVFAPKLMSVNFRRDSIEVSFNVRGKAIKATYIKKGRASGACALTQGFLNGRELPVDTVGLTIREQDLKEKHNTVMLYLS